MLTSDLFLKNNVQMHGQRYVLLWALYRHSIVFCNYVLLFRAQLINIERKFASSPFKPSSWHKGVESAHRMSFAR